MLEGCTVNSRSVSAVKRNPNRPPPHLWLLHSSVNFYRSLSLPNVTSFSMISKSKHIHAECCPKTDHRVRRMFFQPSFLSLSENELKCIGTLLWEIPNMEKHKAWEQTVIDPSSNEPSTSS